jgi:predicted dehydrogenase
MLKVAILGVQHYHANFWTRAFRESPAADVAGIWDPEPQRAADFAARHGVEIHEDPDRLVGGSDAVAICSATAGHRALVELAARRGRPVLCEKPLGRDLEDAREIRRIVDAAGIAFMQSFPKRFDPVNHEIRDLLGAGAIGTVTMCRVRHGHSHGLDPEFRTGWFVDPARSGGGTLIDEGVHAADFLNWLFGMPEWIAATVSRAALGLPVEDAAFATLSFPDGMIAEIATSWTFAAADTSIEIYGTGGTILLGGVDIASRPTRSDGFLRVFRRTGDGGAWSASETVPHFKTGVFHEHVAWAFAEALGSGAAMPVTLADGLAAQAVIDAAYRSAASGRRVKVEAP